VAKKKAPKPKRAAAKRKRKIASKPTWKDFFERGPRATEDFLPDREQPPHQERDFGWD
jgi:hypothetical protein